MSKQCKSGGFIPKYKSFLNYTGGKYRQLNQILPYFPNYTKRFVDLFAGSSVVSENYQHADSYLINDRCLSLINLQKTIIKKSDFEKQVRKTIKEYHLSDSSRYGYTFYHTDSSHGLGSFNKSSYLRLRADYNRQPSSVKLYVLLIYSFNNNLRFNQSGQFNMPVGKRDWNASIRKKLSNFYQVFASREVDFQCTDFNQVTIKAGDFVYADPPYSMTTATYNHDWSVRDDKRLMAFLNKLTKRHIKFALSDVLFYRGRINKNLVAWSKNYHVHDLGNYGQNINYHSNSTKRNEVLITNY